MKRLLIDSCYWFAFFNEKDQYHIIANKMADTFNNPSIKFLVPFPSMYETLNTAFVDNKNRLKSLSEILSNHEKVEFIFDDKYRDNAYTNTISQENSSKVSLVDSIIIEMLQDRNLAIDGVVTFNSRDFAEPCRILNKEMICYV